MIIYDDTQHHQGIDLGGNDINKAKFPRIERDGLFIDEVRSNPTTGLLEIWDGTQWLGYIDTGTLPEGTANQTLRHNGTEWVANNELTIADGDGVKISGYGYDGVLTVESTSNDTYNPCVLNLILSDSGSMTGSTFIRTMPVINGRYPFEVFKDGSIASVSLRGTGSAILEATDAGMVQRLTMPIAKAKIVDRVLTEDTFMFYFTSDDLGIEPDLRNKITSFEVYRRRAEQVFYSTGAVTLADKQLSYDSISFASNDGITAGDTVRVAVAYIDGIPEIPEIPDTSVPNAPVMIGYNPDGFVVSWGMV